MKSLFTRRDQELPLRQKIAQLQEEKGKQLQLINRQTQFITELKQAMQAQAEQHQQALAASEAEKNLLLSYLQDLGVNAAVIQEDEASWQKAKSLVSLTIKPVKVGERPEFTNRFQLSRVMDFLQQAIAVDLPESNA